MTADFLITALIIVAIPGTGALYTIATGLSEGRRSALVAAFGCTLGILPHAAAAITGLAAILHGSPLAFNVIRICGVLYLLYMAIGMLRTRPAGALDQRTERSRGGAIVAKAILINLLNPKLSLFFLAFLPQFVDPQPVDAIPQMMRDSLVFMVLTFVVFAAYGRFAAGLRNHVMERPNILAWLNRGFAAAFLAMGVKLALAQR